MISWKILQGNACILEYLNCQVATLGMLHWHPGPNQVDADSTSSKHTQSPSTL